MTISQTPQYSEQYHVIRNHPYVVDLLSTGKYDVQHAYDQSDEHKQHSLTAGTLIGPDLIAHTPLSLSLKQHIIDETNQSELIVVYHLGSRLCGHKGIIHGGLLATLVDESFCRCGFPVLPNKLGVTAKLDIQYLAPTPANSIVVIRAFTTSVEGRKVYIDGTLSQLPAPKDYDLEKELVVSVKAKVLLVEPRWVSKLDKMPQGPQENSDGASIKEQQEHANV
jgi:acyl-coenzyme A thioesterase PaaI-like protein